MSRWTDLNVILKHTYSEPRFVAQIEWGRQYSIGSQLLGQVPPDELEEYVETGQHPNPDRAITLVVHEEPNWDWWEPTSQWRREAARERELAVRLADAV